MKNTLLFLFAAGFAGLWLLCTTPAGPPLCGHMTSCLTGALPGTGVGFLTLLTGLAVVAARVLPKVLPPYCDARPGTLTLPGAPSSFRPHYLFNQVFLY